MLMIRDSGVPVSRGPERRIKADSYMSTSPHHSPAFPLLSPFFDPHPPSRMGSCQWACRPHGGVDLGRFTVGVTIRTSIAVRFVVPPLNPPPLIRPLQRYAGPCLCTQVLAHITITAYGLSRGGSGYYLRVLFSHRYPPLDFKFALVDASDTWTHGRPC